MGEKSGDSFVEAHTDEPVSTSELVGVQSDRFGEDRMLLVTTGSMSSDGLRYAAMLSETFGGVLTTQFRR
jgi:hypothetical protein